MIVVVDGNIGAGKTTFCTELCAWLGSAEGLPVVFVPEPLDKWTDANGTNLLQLFYRNKKRWALTFQIYALITFQENEAKALRLSREGNVVIMERSTFSALEIFDTMIAQDYYTPAERKVFDSLKTVTKSPLAGYEDVVHVYLNTPPAVCFDRYLKRARREEAGNIVYAYLQRLHHVHELKMRPGVVHNSLLAVDGTTYRPGSLGWVSLLHSVDRDRCFVSVLVKLIKRA